MGESTERKGQPLHILAALAQSGGWPPFRAEELDATWVSDDTALLDVPPAFAPGLSRGDLVSVRNEGDEVWLIARLEPGPRSTIRLIGRHGYAVELAAEVVRALGCTVVASPLDGLVAVDIGPEVDYGAVYRALITGYGDRWEFEESSITDEHA